MNKQWKMWLVAAGVLGIGWTAWSMLLHRAAIEAPMSPSPTVAFAAPIAGLRVHVFQTGRMDIPAWSVALGGSGTRHMDQPAYLIEHPRHGLLMFEAGHHSEIARDAYEHLGWTYTLGLLPMEQSPGQDARTQLRAAGFDPDAVRHIVVSHFHPEHVGAVEEFPQATIVADAREIDWAQHDPDYNYVTREYDDVKRWRGHDSRHSAAFGAFAGAVDLFGDGSVFVVSTPGHTPGHVSLAINLAGGPVLLTGDAAWTELNLTSRSIGLPFVSSDGPAARASLGQVLRFAADNPHVLIVPGHDLDPIRRAHRTDLHIVDWPKPEPATASVR